MEIGIFTPNQNQLDSQSNDFFDTPPPYTFFPNHELETVLAQGPVNNFSNPVSHQASLLRERLARLPSSPLISDFVLPSIQPFLSYKLMLKKSNKLSYLNIFTTHDREKKFRIIFSQLNISLDHIKSNTQLGRMYTINSHPDQPNAPIEYQTIFSLQNSYRLTKSSSTLTAYKYHISLTIEDKTQFVKYIWRKGSSGYKLYRLLPTVPLNHTSRRSRQLSDSDVLIATLSPSISSNGSNNVFSINFIKLQTDLNTLHFIMSSSYVIRNQLSG